MISNFDFQNPDFECQIPCFDFQYQNFDFQNLEFDFQTPDKQQISGKARIYFVKNKLLQQLVFYVAKDGLEPKVTRFLDSLSLLNKAKK